MKPYLPILLLALSLAPACAPKEPPETAYFSQRKVIILTPTPQSAPVIATLYDSLENVGNRVLISGYAGETAAELTARLPWLLQPGVDLFIYDHDLAGQNGEDSLKNYLLRVQHAARVVSLRELSGHSH